MSTKNFEPQQDALFDINGPDEEVGYRVPIACQVAGITYRQLDYGARPADYPHGGGLRFPASLLFP